MTIEHPEATDIRAVPALALPGGFRLLVLREFFEPGIPSSFGLVMQEVIRQPHRVSRNAVFFGATFRADIMSWLVETLGRPAVRDANGELQRNPAWPSLTWHGERREWTGGLVTGEWFVDILFPEAAACAAFAERWRERLGGAAAGSDEVSPPAA